MTGNFLTSCFTRGRSCNSVKSGNHYKVLQGNSQFTSELFQALAENESDSNLFFSPISIHAVLSMAYQGALGSTLEHLASILKIPEPKATAEGYKRIMNVLNSAQDITLHLANKIYLMKGFKLQIDFETAVKKNFLSELQLVDFEDGKKSSKIINKWVEEKTRGKIKDIINPEFLNELTRLVLVNAIYFKGKWKYQFNKENTITRPFFINNVDIIHVQMMYIVNKFFYKYDEELDAQILQMPYTNKDFSLLIILPDRTTDIANLEKKIATVNFANITKDLKKTKVHVFLPKFKIEKTIDLKDVLIKLGLREIFDEEKANFKGMIKSNENLYVDKVVQKCFIEVNEEGAEAAAATAAVVSLNNCETLKVPKIITFNADHPFVYYIIGPNGCQLFAGVLRKIESNTNLNRSF